MILSTKEKGTYIMPKPFHEAVIGLINDTDRLHLGCLGKVIMATKVPEHSIDSIVAAWKAKTRNHSDSSPVVANLLARKVLEEAHADEICETRGD